MNRDNIHSHVAMAGRVIRYHTWPVQRTQTVGEHAWRVAIIYVEVFGLPRVEVLYYILHHDSGEQFAGDVPYDSKRTILGLRDAMNLGEAEGLRRMGIEMPQLSAQEWERFKLCDLLEMWEYGSIEVHSGNRFATPVVVSTEAELRKRTMNSDDGMLIRKWLHRERERYEP